jgi:hypothetical protein
MERVLADAEAAELPVYLETAKPENVPYYRTFGFLETGHERLPRGAPLWLTNAATARIAARSRRSRQPPDSAGLKTSRTAEDLRRCSRTRFWTRNVAPRPSGRESSR